VKLHGKIQLLAADLGSQLPKFQDVLSRTIKLVKPGGWLLLEDADRIMYDDGGLGPGQKGLWKAFQRRTGNEDIMTGALVGSAYEGLLKASDSFSEINVKKVCLPISRPSNGALLREAPNKSSQNFCKQILKSGSLALSLRLHRSLPLVPCWRTPRHSI
jgi:hypothetical protein